MKLSDEQLAMLSPTEQEIYRNMKVAEEAGRNPLLEADLDLAPGSPEALAAAAAEAAKTKPIEAAPPPADNTEANAPAPAHADAPAPAPAPAEAAPAPAPAPAPAAEAPAPAPAEAAPAPAPTEQPQDVTFDIPEVPEDDLPQLVPIAELEALRTKRTELRDQVSAIDDKWSDGQITSEERKQQLAPLHEQIDGITGALATEQMKHALVKGQQDKVIQGIITHGKSIGVDYASNPTLQTQFNAVLDALDKDPANKALSFNKLAGLAHKTVCVLQGKVPGAAAPAPTPAAATPAAAPAPKPAAAAPAAPAPAPRQAPPAPPTLRTMPSAEVPNSTQPGGTVMDQILTGTPDQMEAAFGRLTKAQRDQLLHQAR